MDSFDVSTAFLQQDAKFYESRRQEIFLIPPPEYLDSNDGPDTVWRCVKTSYGMSDAPRAWYLSLHLNPPPPGMLPYLPTFPRTGVARLAMIHTQIIAKTRGEKNLRRPEKSTIRIF